MRADAFVPWRGSGSAPGRLVPLLVLATALAALPLYAQSVLGTIRGTVTDPQGAVVKSAAVMVTDEATGVPRSVDTDDEGRYEVSNLRPGSYRLTTRRTGFKANDAHSRYLEMGSPKTLAPAQLRELQSLTRDLPETTKVVRIGRDGRYSVRISMRTNDVVLLLVEPALGAHARGGTIQGCARLRAPSSCHVGIRGRHHFRGAYGTDGACPAGER